MIRDTIEECLHEKAYGPIRRIQRSESLGATLVNNPSLQTVSKMVALMEESANLL